MKDKVNAADNVHQAVRLDAAWQGFRVALQALHVLQECQFPGSVFLSAVDHDVERHGSAEVAVKEIVVLTQFFGRADVLDRVRLDDNALIKPDAESAGADKETNDKIRVIDGPRGEFFKSAAHTVEKTAVAFLFKDVSRFRMD